MTELGFSLHAATSAGAQDRRGREALVQYILRPPIAQERLRLLPDDLVRIELKKPFRDGTWAIDLDPLSLLCRTRFPSLFAARAKLGIINSSVQNAISERAKCRAGFLLLRS